MTNFSISDTDYVRFVSKISNFGAKNQCWPWNAPLDNGYGRFWLNNKTDLAHRISYQLFVGSINNNLHIDHLCRNRSCVNPEHMEQVTIKTNVLRGVGLTAVNANKTHCKRGHLLNQDNLYFSSRKARVCKKCQKIRHAKWRSKNV